MDTRNLVAWLPFDNSTTFDWCGNEWTLNGALNVDSTNAISGNALQLTGNGDANYLQLDGIALGGRDFTVHAYVYSDTTSNEWARFFAIYDPNNMSSRRICVQATKFEINGSTGGTFTRGTRYHVAIVYQHSTGTLTTFLDGVKQGTKSVTFAAGVLNRIYIGKSEWSGYSTLTGTVDEFIVHDGIALWTENFTPPTAEDYDISDRFTVDLQRRVTNVTIKFKPEVFASWIPTGEIYFKPEVFASIINDGTPLDFTADLSRNVTRTESFTADLQRSLTEVNAFTVDTQRTITRSVNMRVDIQRKLSNAVDFTADAQRSLINRVDFSVDLQRTLVQLNDFTVDLQRQTVWEWLTRILPESSFLDDKMLASAKALDVQITKFHQAIREVLHLPRLDELSGTILDLLAEQFHVDYYDAINFSDEEKRNLIRQSIAWHRLKGTPAAVEMVLQDAFKDLRIDEWFTYGGEPYFFRLWTKGYISTPERFKSFWLMFMDAKNVRSHLEMVTIDISHDEPIQLYTGVAKVTSGLKIIDLPKHDDAKINLHTGVAIVNVGQKIIGLPKHNDIHTKIYSGVYQIHTGTIFIGMKRNPF